MKRVRVIPVLLIKGRGFYKTIQFKKPNYLGDPLNAVKIFNDKYVDEIIILDIIASKEKKEPDYELIGDIASECFMPMTYGGGIKTFSEAKKIFSLGIEKIIINSQFHDTPGLITEIVDKYGSQSTVISIDYRKNVKGKAFVYTHSGKVNTGYDPVTYAQRATAAGAGELMINSIDRDGMRLGYDTDILKQVASAVNVPLIACGGAGCMEDLYKGITLGNSSAVAAGSLFVYIGQSTDSILIHYPSEDDLNNLYGRL
jgi:cyclase